MYLVLIHYDKVPRRTKKNTCIKRKSEKMVSRADILESKPKTGGYHVCSILISKLPWFYVGSRCF